MIGHKEYFEYLKSRSLKSILYKNFFVYPKINKCIQGKCLDLGCSIGDFLNYKKDVIGVDINKYNVDYCNSRGLEAYLMKIDKLPFDSNSFDSILLDNVLEHLNSPEKLIYEISRVIKKSGNFVIGVPGKKGFDHDLDHKVFYDEIHLEKFISKFQFKLESYFYTPLKSEYLNLNSRHYCVWAHFKKR